MDFYDSDPSGRELDTEAAQARVKEGFRRLVESLQGAVDTSAVSAKMRHIEQLRRSNAYFDMLEERPVWERLGFSPPRETPEV